MRKRKGILRLLSAPSRYIKKKSYKKLVKKEPRKTAKVVYNEEMLKRKSIDELKEIAKLGRIKNRGKLKKEGLIISLLKSEISNAERNYIKYFNTNVNNNTNASDNTVSNNTIVSNNTNASNNTDDDTYDGKIRGKISDIRLIFSGLGNIVTKMIERKLKKSFVK